MKSNTNPKPQYKHIKNKLKQTNKSQISISTTLKNQIEKKMIKEKNKK
jgi:DNA-binding sugar fermentation-stimulating protein